MQAESKRNILSSKIRDGFTLIEVLTVVAIITLLMAILIPILNKARDSAIRIVCKSNVRQIAYAWHMYLDDYDGAFLQGVNTNLNYGGWEGEGGFGGSFRPLNDYVGLPPIIKTEKDARVFRCPADTGGIPGAPDVESAYQYFGTSYQTNWLLIGPTAIGYVPPELTEMRDKINERLIEMTLGRASNPTKLLLTGDYHWISQWLPFPNWSDTIEWHNRCCHYNVAFLDGHVEFLHIRKGLFAAPEYSVIPFKDLSRLAHSFQQAQVCPDCGL